MEKDRLGDVGDGADSLGMGEMVDCLVCGPDWVLVKGGFN